MIGKTCNLPTSCPCGSKFDIQHSMSCKKDGFISIRHSDLQNITANMMLEVCNVKIVDTEAEPKLTPLSGEELQGITSNNSKEARVDIRTRGFWERGHQQAFRRKGVQPQHLLLSQQVLAAVICYE